MRTLVGSLVLLLVAAGITAGTWWFVAGRWASIPDVRQFTVARATSTLEAAGFRVANGPGQASETVPKGSVISTQPPGGERLIHGHTVRLTASTGKTYYTVPDVRRRHSQCRRHDVDAATGQGDPHRLHHPGR